MANFANPPRSYRESHHPIRHKKAVVKALTDHAKTFHHHQVVTSTLEANSNQNGLFMMPANHNDHRQPTAAVTETAEKNLCVLPYIKVTSGPIKRI